MRRGSWILCGCVMVALAGCGGDDEPASESASTEEAETTAAAPPATETAAESATDLPASGADKLTASQRAQLLAKNNALALGDDGPSVTGPLVAANIREYAEPLGAGKCKEALSDSADTWEALAKADKAGDAAQKKTLGEKTLENSTRVFSSC